MSFFKENYIRLFVWLGADPPPNYKHLQAKPRLKQENNIFSRSKNVGLIKNEVNLERSLGNLLYNGLCDLAENIIPPLNTLLSTFFIMLVFLGTDQILFLIFKQLTLNIQEHYPFVVFFFEGTQMLSAFSILIYFIISGIANLRYQWQFSQYMEKQSGLVE